AVGRGWPTASLTTPACPDYMATAAIHDAHQMSRLRSHGVECGVAVAPGRGVALPIPLRAGGGWRVDRVSPLRPEGVVRRHDLPVLRDIAPRPALAVCGGGPHCGLCRPSTGGRCAARGRS